MFGFLLCIDVGDDRVCFGLCSNDILHHLPVFILSLVDRVVNLLDARCPVRVPDKVVKCDQGML